jgi:hypothetical protein
VSNCSDSKRLKRKSCIAVLAALATAAATPTTQEPTAPKHPPAAQQSASTSRPAFELYQAEVFSEPGGQPLQWADVDGDGDLDLFIGFARGRPNRLYLNEKPKFRNVAADVGLADMTDTRAAAWGDFDTDGDPDLYVGFADGKTPARIYRNDKGGAQFTDVARELGIALTGVSRQATWVDYDGDGDLDLYAGFRDKPNRLFRNDGAHFVDVSKEAGMDDPRKTVGMVWWDFDEDGDLDAFVANQEGDPNGLFRNDGGRFVDVAAKVGVAAAGRLKEEGSVGPGLADFDLDGDLDLFVANYGPSVLYRNEGKGQRFVDVAKESGIYLPGHTTTTAWGDVDNDGWPDLYLATFIAGEPTYRDWFFRNGGPGASPRFTEVMPDLLLADDATHGVQWVDFDRDGALDLSRASNSPAGTHHLMRNVGAGGTRSLSVLVTDANGRLTRAGAEVRVFAPGTRRLLSSGFVDSGSGYCSQSAAPVHLGLPPSAPTLVDVEVTVVGRGRRNVTTKKGVDPSAQRGRSLQMRAPL